MNSLDSMLERNKDFAARQSAACTLLPRYGSSSINKPPLSPAAGPPPLAADRTPRERGVNRRIGSQLIETLGTNASRQPGIQSLNSEGDRDLETKWLQASVIGQNRAVRKGALKSVA
jgi:hypothetical protein